MPVNNLPPSQPWRRSSQQKAEEHRREGVCFSFGSASCPIVRSSAFLLSGRAPQSRAWPITPCPWPAALPRGTQDPRRPQCSLGCWPSFPSCLKSTSWERKFGYLKQTPMKLGVGKAGPVEEGLATAMAAAARSSSRTLLLPQQHQESARAGLLLRPAGVQMVPWKAAAVCGGSFSKSPAAPEGISRAASVPGPVPGAGQKDSQEEKQQGWQEGWLRLVLPGKGRVEGSQQGRFRSNQESQEGRWVGAGQGGHHPG